jgi:GNAT superfamily N-acetyltransferase
LVHGLSPLGQAARARRAARIDQGSQQAGDVRSGELRHRTWPDLLSRRGAAGWISFGPRGDFLKLRRSPVMKPVDDTPVWSVVCSYVAKPYRGRGLQHRLLAAALEYARQNGARVLEAYPVDKADRSHDDFMFFGSRSLYERAGFREVVRRSPTRPSYACPTILQTSTLMNVAGASGMLRSCLKVASAVRAFSSVSNSQKECWMMSPARLRAQ